MIFTKGEGSFIINKDGYLELKSTQSSQDAQVLYVWRKDKKNKTGCFTVRDEMGLFKIISMLNGNIFMDTRKMQFKLFIVA